MGFHNLVPWLAQELSAYIAAVLPFARGASPWEIPGQCITVNNSSDCKQAPTSPALSPQQCQEIS